MTTITKKQAQEIIDAADAVITALAGTNAAVHPNNHTKMCQLYDELNDRYATPEIVRELARITLLSLEREQIRNEHAEWSAATFGNVGPVGPLKHLSKEALEAAADPDDLLEWADMQFLLWDAQRRMGIPDDFITIAMIEKLEINKKRQWPEPKDGEPRLHINTQSAQPVSEPYQAVNDIIAERQRQISEGGWTPEHDDRYDSGELAGAAACYARYTNARGWVFPTNPTDYQSAGEPFDWPLDSEWWKPTNPRRDLVKAGALILADIERLDRAYPSQESE